MKCPNCKRNIPDGSKFCNHCGQRIEESNGVIRCSNPQCGKEIPSDSKFCPFCGKPQTSSSMNLPNLVFPDFTIVLGETTIQELIAISEEKGFECELISDHDFFEYQLSDDVCVVTRTNKSPILSVYMQDYKNALSTWNQIIPIGDEWSIRKLANYCSRANIQFQIYKDDNTILVLLSDMGCVLRLSEDFAEIGIYKLFGCPKCGGIELQLEKIESRVLMMRCKSCKHKFDMLEVWENLKYCPNCGSANITDDGSDHIQFSCNDCKYIWGDEEIDEYEDDDEEEDDEYEDDDEEEDDDAFPSCPKCGCGIVEDDGSDYLQYTCSSCGHNWGHDDTVECPVCGSDDIENDGYDYMQYTCNNCGHNWGDEL